MIGLRLFDTAHDYTLQFTVTYTLVSTVTSSLPLLDSGFQWRTLLFFWLPELSPASAISFSQQRLKTTAPQRLTKDSTHYIVLHGPHRKLRSSVAVQLLLSDGMSYSVVACATIGTNCAENIIPLLFMGRCLVTAGCCDLTVLALSEYATLCYVQRDETVQGILCFCLLSSDCCNVVVFPDTESLQFRVLS
jgi:hypothetical protein